jgi:hypothetical protein
MRTQPRCDCCTVKGRCLSRPSQSCRLSAVSAG